MQKYRSRGVVRVGVFTPQSGMIGLYGPPTRNCAVLACDTLNERGGLNGMTVEPVFADGGQSPNAMIADAQRLLSESHVQAFVGSHVSPNHDRLVEVLGTRVPYVYTLLYEGENHSPGVFMCGETPHQHLLPLLGWIRANTSANSFFLVGTDFSFPRKTMACAKHYMASLDITCVGESYCAAGTEDFSQCLQQIRSSGANAVLVYLVGMDAIRFHRQFQRAGLHTSVIRVAPSLCENTLLGVGREGGSNILAAAGYTDSLKTEAAEDFRARYRRRFSDVSPLPTRFGLAIYEGFLLLADLARRSDGLSPLKMQAVSSGVTLQTPRGECMLENNHMAAPLHIIQPQGVELVPLVSLGQQHPSACNRDIYPEGTAGTA